MAGRLAAGLTAGCLFLSRTLPLNAQAGSPNSPQAEFHVVMPGAVVRTEMQRAIAGAMRRLRTAACQRIFSDFHDESGRPLQSTLDASGETGAERLASLRFIEGGDQRRCLSSSILAFIEPRSHVVYVCGARFERQFSESSEMTEILLIHELLHALGLGENPPAPSEITHRVLTRCSD